MGGMGGNFTAMSLFIWLFVCFIQFSFSEFLKSLFRDYGHKGAYSLYVEIWISFAWPLSNVNFQMPRHLACPRGCITALVAFVWLFSTVCFHMPPQLICAKGCIAESIHGRRRNRVMLLPQISREKLYWFCVGYSEKDQKRTLKLNCCFRMGWEGKGTSRIGEYVSRYRKQISFRVEQWQN